MIKTALRPLCSVWRYSDLTRQRLSGVWVPVNRFRFSNQLVFPLLIRADSSLTFTNVTEIPEDADMAETFYSQFDDEFEESEEDEDEDDYSALLDHMQGALEQSASGVDRTLSEDSIGEGLTDTLKQRRIEALRAYPLISPRNWWDISEALGSFSLPVFFLPESLGCFSSNALKSTNASLCFAAVLAAGCLTRLHASSCFRWLQRRLLHFPWLPTSECQRILGNKPFQRAYEYLKEVRFGDEMRDEDSIMDGLSKIVDKPRDCFLVDQLLFMEKQAEIAAMTWPAWLEEPPCTCIRSVL